MKRSAYDIVRAKRTAEGPPEVPEAADDFHAPFKGWYTRGDVPHCDKPGLMQMITYRLADSMPASRRHEWEALNSLEDARERRTKIEWPWSSANPKWVWSREGRVGRYQGTHLVHANWASPGGAAFQAAAELNQGSRAP